MNYEKTGVGSIINIASVDGLVSGPTAIAYSASKHAVTGMTKGPAPELGHMCEFRTSWNHQNPYG